MKRELLPIKQIMPMVAAVQTLYAERIGKDQIKIFRDEEGMNPLEPPARQIYDDATFCETFRTITGHRIEPICK